MFYLQFAVILAVVCHICAFLLKKLLGAITDKLRLTLVCGQNYNISNDQVKVAANNITSAFFACELWVKRVGTFGVVLYRSK